MAATPQLYLNIRPEYYGQITLDELVTALVSNQGNLLQPPFPQPVLDLSQGSMNTSSLQAFAQQAQVSKISKPWLQWFWAVYRFITSGSANSQLVEVLAPSVDETDDDWWAKVSANVSGSTDPVTVTVELDGVTRFGIQLTITNPGSGYSGTVNVTVSSSNGQGQPAKGTATLSGGGITGWTQTTQGYNLAPPLVVAFGSGAATATAQLGRQFAVGDFIIWNDPTIVSSAYSYEIDQITSITPVDDTHFTCTLARASASAASGGAQYGSLKAAHASGAAFFRLINQSWLLNIDTQAGPQLIRLLWPNMCVAAVAVGQSGQSSGQITVNLAPLPYLPGTTTKNPRLNPPSPGMRTMNGAAYVSLGATGTLAQSQTSAVRVPVQAWESLRTIYGMVRTAPAGPTTFNGDANACIVVYVCYINGTNVGLIDTLIFDAGSTTSYSASNPPDGRQMPYHAYWSGIAPNADWPPNLLPKLTGALNGSGNLQLGFTISTTQSVQFAPDGVIDFIIAQVGTSTAGANLTLAVQT